LQQAEAEVQIVSGQVQALQARRDELVRQVRGEEPILGMSGQGGPGSIRSSVDGPIADFEQQLADLRIKVTDKHPDVLRIQQTLTDLYAIRDEERARLAAAGASGDRSSLDSNPVYQQLRIALSEADSELAALRQQLGQRQAAVAYLKRMLDTIPVVEADMNRLDRDYEVVKRQYDALLQRLESARLSDDVQTDGEQVVFEVIEPPRVPLSPSAPNRELFFAIVLGAAVAVGLGVAFLFSQHSPVFYSAQGLAKFAGLPVFGSVGLARPRQLGRGDVLFAASTAVLVVAFGLLLVLGRTGISIGNV
jgi:polysaccharide chain length determinant protein (PEP-CTERM system associated)